MAFGLRENQVFLLTLILRWIPIGGESLEAPYSLLDTSRGDYLYLHIGVLSSNLMTNDSWSFEFVKEYFFN